MMKRIALLVIGLLPLTAACGDPTGPLLEPDERCGRDGSAVAAFASPGLAAAVRQTISIGANVPLTCAKVTSLTTLAADFAGISDLAGAQNLTGLTDLILAGNSIVDLSPLSGLTTLEFLDLRENGITDLSPLGGLTGR